MSNTISQQYFGTDGIRGRVGDSLVNPEFVLKLGWAAGMVLRDKIGNNNSKILIGKDTRISGYLLESVLEAGLSAAGVNTFLLGPMPTPAVAYLTRTLRAEAGIVISASHNPYYDNGIKIFSPHGTKLADEFEQAIERQIDMPMKVIDAAALGKAKRVNDAPGRYIEFCKSTIGLNNTLAGMKIVVDCANGATYHVAPSVFRELGAKVIELATSPDGFNINENCGSTAPGILAKTVIAENADLGIAFDGDGDRVIMVDHKGEIVDGDELLFVMAKNGFSKGNLVGGVIGTVMSNLGLEVALRDLGVDFERTKVGDRHVIEALKKKRWLLGGESSGHIVHLGITTTGDGIISALQVLTAVCDTELTLHDLKKQMTKMPQTLINVKLERSVDINDSRIQNTLRAVEARLGKHGRVLLRKSGTEPLFRIMVEGEDAAEVSNAANELAEVIRKAINN